MKKIFLILSFIASSFFASAQFGNLLDKAKKKAEDKINQKTEKKVDDAVDGSKPGATNEQNETASASATENNSSSVKVFSKFDFVPGEKIVVFEDFMQDAVGDF